LAKKSLQNQQSWNKKMQRDVEIVQESVRSLKSTVGVLEEKIKVLWLEYSQRGATGNSKATPSKQQARNTRH
jgi:hypothetical protein